MFFSCDMVERALDTLKTDVMPSKKRKEPPIDSSFTSIQGVKEKKQQSETKSRMEAAWTVMTKETDKTTGVLPAPTMGYLLDYLNHT